MTWIWRKTLYSVREVVVHSSEQREISWGWVPLAENLKFKTGINSVYVRALSIARTKKWTVKFHSFDCCILCKKMCLICLLFFDWLETWAPGCFVNLYLTLVVLWYVQRQWELLTRADGDLHCSSKTFSNNAILIKLRISCFKCHFWVPQWMVHQQSRWR